LWLLHVLGIELAVLLLLVHWHSLVHVWCAGGRVCQGGTSSSLMRRVWKWWHLAALPLERRIHTTTALVLRISKLTICRRKAHRLRREWCVKTPTASAALWRKSTTTPLVKAWTLIVSLCRLGGFSSQMSSLLRCKRSLVSRCLSHMTLKHK